MTNERLMFVLILIVTAVGANFVISAVTLRSLLAFLAGGP